MNNQFLVGIVQGKPNFMETICRTEMNRLYSTGQIPMFKASRRAHKTNLNRTERYKEGSPHSLHRGARPHLRLDVRVRGHWGVVIWRDVVKYRSLSHRVIVVDFQMKACWRLFNTFIFTLSVNSNIMRIISNKMYNKLLGEPRVLVVEPSRCIE